MPDLLISFSPLKYCFISIPLRYANALWDQHSDPFKIVLSVASGGSSSKQSTLYVGWNGGCSQPIGGKETLEIDTQWAKLLGFKEGQVVNMNVVSHQIVSQEADSVKNPIIHVEPLNEDDWEILELNAGLLEEQFLNQARVIQEGGIVTIWAHNQSFINIKVGKILISKLTSSIH